MDTPSLSVNLEGEPLDCGMSPSANVLAAALVTGQLQLVNFSSDGGNAPATAEGASASSLSSTVSITIAAPSRNTISSAAPSKGNSKGSSKEDDEDDDDPDQDDGDTPSCRAVCFAAGGGSVLAGYADAAVRLYDSSTGKLSATYAGHHKEQISRVFSVDGNVFASGDEAGAVALWDVRAPPQQAPLYKYGKHTDYVTDFALHERDQALVVCSGDGTISIHDLRKRKVLARSEDDADDELLSCAVVKGGKKVVCGTQSGVMALYSWGYFNDCSDRFPGHPESVQALVAWDQDTLLTGSSDGGIRIVGVLPNKLIGILGQHNGDFPVERLALSYDRRVLASTSHDSVVKLWDMGLLLEDDDEEEEGEEGEGEEGVEGAEALLARARAAGGGGSEDDEDEDEDFEEGEGESEDGEGEEGDGSAGEGEEEGVKGAGGAVGGGKQKRGAGGEVEKGKGGKQGLAAGPGSGDGSDGGGGDSDSDSDAEGGRKKKRAKREPTKWTKGTEQKKKPSGNFFADLL